MKKNCRIVLALVVVVTLFGCKDVNQNILPENTDSPNKQVVIGDDVIYGETFDLHSLFESEIRAEGTLPRRAQEAQGRREQRSGRLRRGL